MDDEFWYSKPFLFTAAAVFAAQLIMSLSSQDPLRYFLMASAIAGICTVIAAVCDLYKPVAAFGVVTLVFYMLALSQAVLNHLPA